MSVAVDVFVGLCYNAYGLTHELIIVVTHMMDKCIGNQSMYQYWSTVTVSMNIKN